MGTWELMMFFFDCGMVALYTSQAVHKDMILSSSLSCGKPGWGGRPGGPGLAKMCEDLGLLFRSEGEALENRLGSSCSFDNLISKRSGCKNRAQ
jgi:hypothetical protein